MNLIGYSSVFVERRRSGGGLPTTRPKNIHYLIHGRIDVVESNGVTKDVASPCNVLVLMPKMSVITKGDVMESQRLYLAIATVLSGYSVSQAVAAQNVSDKSSSVTSSANNSSDSPDAAKFRVYFIAHDAGTCEAVTPSVNTCKPVRAMRPLTASEISQIPLKTQEHALLAGANLGTITSRTITLTGRTRGTGATNLPPVSTTAVTHGYCDASGCHTTATVLPHEPVTAPPTTGHPPSGAGGDNPQLDCLTPLPPANRADSNVVFTHEGGVRQDGYILPPAKFPNSGFTIGAGVDLGQQSPAGLLSMGVPQSIVTYLTPWIGSQYRGAAAAALEAQIGDPQLSAADAETLSLAVFNNDVSLVANNYNAAVTGYTFYQLPENTQTAIVDVSYPNGPNLAKSAPSFWGDVTGGKWTASANDLSDWYNNTSAQNPSRYTDDANAINADISKGSLPSNQSNGICP